MKKLLKQFIEKQAVFTEEEIVTIMHGIQVETFPKHTILLKQGEVSSACYFILRGLIRQYFIDEEGREITSNIFTEEQAVVLFHSYKNKLPSDSFIACSEDSTVIVGTLDSEASMYNEFPAIEKLTRSMVEKSFGAEQMDRARFMASSPEQRYKTLLATRPELIQRVPQHQLASYLGITPESLSRMKKRISQV